MKNSEHNALEEIDLLKASIDALYELALMGCRAEGAHHKQWYLEQILDALGWNVDALRDWEPSISP